MIDVVQFSEALDQELKGTSVTSTALRPSRSTADQSRSPRPWTSSTVTSAGRLTFASPVHKVSLIAEVDDGDDIETPVGTNRPSRLHRERADVSYAFTGDRSRLLVFLGQLDTEETGTPGLPMDIRFVKTDFAGMQAAIEVSDGFSISARTAWNDVEHLMDNFGLRQAPMPMAQRQSFTAGSGGEARIAASVKVDAWTIDFGLFASAAEHDAVMERAAQDAGAEYIVLAGYMRILSEEFVSRWTGKIINIHPSLLPKYKGLDTHQRAIDAGDSHGGAANCPMCG